MAKTTEASENMELHTISTVQTTWGEFVIDADKAAEAVAELLSHYRRSRAGGYSLSDRWIQQSVTALSESCLVSSTEHPTNNAGCRV